METSVKFSDSHDGMGRQTEDKIVFKTFEFSLRLFAGYFIFIYGILKPWQFGDAYSSNSDPVNELGGMALMWSFFAYSKTVPIVVGIFECSGAILLVFNRTKLIGAAVLLPVMSTIALFDLVYGVSPIATANAIAFLVILLLVFFFERARIRSAIGCLIVNREPTASGRRLLFRRLSMLIGFLLLNWTVLNLCHWLGGGATCLVWLIPMLRDFFSGLLLFY